MVKYIDDFLDAIQAILLSLLTKLGPFFVALMPALFTGYAVFAIFAPVAGYELALIFALVVSFAIETVGIVLSHTAIEQYNGYQRGKVDRVKLFLMIMLVPVYLFSVSGTVWYAEDAFNLLVRGLGIASPFLTCSVYIAVALARDLKSIEQDELADKTHKLALEQDERQHKRDLERIKLRMEQDERIRKLELKAQVQIEQAKSQHNASIEPAQEQKELAQSQHACSDCSRQFSTIQALNAHRRFCISEGADLIPQTTGHRNGKRQTGGENGH